MPSRLGNEGAYDVASPPNKAVVRLQAIPVEVTQTSGTPAISPLTLNPDANGCIFAEVPGGTPASPDTYTIALEQPTSGIPGYVGTPPFVNANNQTASAITPQTASVVSGLEAVVSLGAFDEATQATRATAAGQQWMQESSAPGPPA